jgi:hypothetical protein
MNVRTTKLHEFLSVNRREILDRSGGTTTIAPSPKRHLLEAGGLSAYVEIEGRQGEHRVVLCRACGASSLTLAPDQETEWFKRHAAEDREEHRRARPQEARARAALAGSR